MSEIPHIASTSRRAALRTLATGMALTTFRPTLAKAQAATPVASSGDWDVVEAIAIAAEQAGGMIGIAVFDSQGERFSRHGNRRFRAASTIKAPIMIAAYRMLESGSLSLDDPYRLRDEDHVPGSGVLSHLHAGLDLTFGDLLLLMIAVSDNTATNVVIDRVGMDAVNATMQSLGMTDSVLGRRILGRLPAPGDPENWATPTDFARAIQAIVSSEAASPENCAQMLATLEQQGEIRRISRFLTGPDLTWGTKPGDLLGVINDVGFVASDRGTASIAVFCEDLPDLDQAERAIGLIAREALAITGIIPFGPDQSDA